MDNNEIQKNTILKVLILEDSLLDLELISEQLSAAGYQLESTHTQTEAGFREAIQNTKFDIILSDFKLPGFDAFGALEICQQICPEVPFICVSGSIGEETAIELLKKGAIDYVLKDRPGRLPFAVQRALKGVQGKTARLNASRDLQESENRFRQVAKTAQECIWEVDTNGLYTYTSPVIESILGYKPEELVGNKCFFDLFDPEKAEKYKEAAFKIFSQKKVFRKIENTLVHKNGKLVITSTSGSPIFDENGIYKGYRGVNEDITDRKNAEEALHMKMQELERYHTLMVGREIAMIELKKEVNSLLNKLGEEAKYKIVD